MPLDVQELKKNLVGGRSYKEALEFMVISTGPYQQTVEWLNSECLVSGDPSFDERVWKT